MPEKFPEVLPPKGEGRVDSKHRVALLTEPEIEALNFLKNMDKAMGYKSGFSPMMQNLAAQNTQPLEYVEYRGEKIGEFLIQRIKKEAKEKNWPYVSWITKDDNYRARTLYDRIATKTDWNVYELSID